MMKPYVGGGFGPKAAANPWRWRVPFVHADRETCEDELTAEKQVFLHSRARHQFVHDLTTGVTRMALSWPCITDVILEGGAYSVSGSPPSTTRGPFWEVPIGSRT